MTLRRGESCGSGVQCTMGGNEKEDDVKARGSGLHSVPLVAVEERVTIGFRTAQVVRLPWRMGMMGMMGKERRSIQGRLLNFFCADKSSDKKPADSSTAARVWCMYLGTPQSSPRARAALQPSTVPLCGAPELVAPTG